MGCGAGFPALWRLVHGVNAVYLFGAAVAGGDFHDLGFPVHDLGAGAGGGRFVLAEGELLANHVISFQLIGLGRIFAVVLFGELSKAA